MGEIDPYKKFKKSHKISLDKLNVLENKSILRVKNLKKEQKSHLEKIDFLNDKKNTSQYVALLGDSGMRKTWSCMKIALELKEEDTPLNPIYLDLRHFASSEAINKEFDWEEIINIVIRKSLNQFKQDMSVSIIFEIIKKGKAFILFDGLDEVTVHLTL
ncbi:MAG: Unknown protein [uncultured Sulfurovum sp.]|uniref:NACHT domain-containing protein n=1 Tax=uncultured Sulfurovum sp. TaxID=269237 RepID=A0A6S6TZ41_9BACT|nr:MAG: Unknown protein [uncultured Sulfurovum sp.]